MKKESTSILLLPSALLLALLIGLYAFTEYKMAYNESSMRVIFESEGDGITHKLMEDAKTLWRSAVVMHASDYGEDRKKEIEGGIENIRKWIKVLRGYFSEQEELEEHAEEMRMLEKIEELAASFKIPDNPVTDERELAEMQDNAKKVTDLALDLLSSVSTSHRVELSKKIKLLENLKRDRSVILIFLVMSGLTLLLLNYSSAANCRRNAESIKSTVRFNALFAAALQSTRVGVLIREAKEKDSPVVFVNRAFTSITGYAPEDVLGNKTDFLFGWHTDPVMVAKFKESMAQRQTATFDLLTYRKSGAPFWSEWHISPVVDKDDDGKEVLTHYVSLLTDITAGRQTQEALMLAKEQAERANAVKSNFLAVMSHEIRTPINGLLGVLDLLKGTSLDSEQKRFVDIAVSSGRALHELINDILDFSKMEAGKIEIISDPFSLGDLLRDVVDLTAPVAQQKKLYMKTYVSEGVPDKLVSDQGRIRQILLNLITNAIKFTDYGGVEVKVIHLLTEEKEGGKSALLRFEIIDTGIGISTNDQDKLFKEFSQVQRSFKRRFGGTGLGLAITRRLVKLLGGEIGMESQPSKGSKFWFILPLQIDESRAGQGSNCEISSGRVALPTSRAEQLILLVEDNETNRLVAGKYLEKAGYKYETACDATEAISKVDDKVFDLILMDVSMPDMDGFEATRCIRAKGGWALQIPIIALTAHAMPGDRDRCIQAGMSDYMNKPLNYAKFVGVLDRWLHADSGVSKKQDKEVEKRDVSDEEIDFGTLKALADDLGNDTLLRVTQVFLVDMTNRINSLKCDVDTADLEEIKLVSHSLKSSSANCGLIRFSALMQNIEHACVNEDREALSSLLDNVQEAYVSARQALVNAREKFRS